MSTPLVEIEGIGPRFAQKLQAAGIQTVEALLEAGRTRRQREQLSVRTEIGEGKILDWVNRADLMRVSGIGSEFADLLEAAGIDSVPELAQRNPTLLAQKLTKVNDEKRLTRVVPNESQVRDWIEQSKKLPTAVEH